MKVILALVCFSLVGCVTAREINTRSVTKKAAFDLSCSANQIKVISTGTTSYGATGCGKKAQYTCPRTDMCIRN